MFKKLAATLVLALLFVSTANAVTVFEFNAGADTPLDFQLVGGAFGTIDDGDAGTPGDQNGEIELLAPVLTPAVIAGSLTLDGVALSGVASVAGGAFAQATAGGTFEFYNAAGALLLGGSFGAGSITGVLGSSVGSAFSADITLLSGLLLSAIEEPAAFALSLKGVTAPFHLDGNGYIADFASNGNGGFDATGVPEPATVGLMTLGLAGLAARRRQSKLA